MKRFSTLFLAAAVALVGSVFTANNAEATPNFARQVGVGCSSCHFQHIPKLNAFGREFKLGGYTQSSQELIEDDGLSITPVLNMGVVVKSRYQMRTYKTAASVKVKEERGRWDLDDELAVILGGRLGDNFGYLTEGHELGGGNAKFIFSKNFGGVQGGVTVFHTQGGAGHGMNLINNASRFNRPWELRDYTQATKAVGGSITLANGNTAGVGFFAANELFLVNLTQYGMTDQSGTYDLGTGGLATYYAIEISPRVMDGMDLRIGVQGSTGTMQASNYSGTYGSVTAGATEVDKYDAKSTAVNVEAQLQDVGGFTLDVYANMVTNPKSGTSSSAAYNGNAYNSSTSKDTGAYNLGASLGAGHNTFKANILQVTENGSSKKWNATAIGANFGIRQNIELVLEYASIGGDGTTHRSHTLVMLEYAI